MTLANDMPPDHSLDDLWFAGHPWHSPRARRALELHWLIGRELNGDADAARVAGYRAELDEIRDCGDPDPTATL